ncbi:hypothetical protein CVU37_02610 [candidate division BRC1 bacterium HGW-BRC1-1]|nr:MAG: hypothetical protein CVU37_02610 [candidate division BRC1 bacterium HGW-BRC1-1]
MAGNLQQQTASYDVDAAGGARWDGAMVSDEQTTENAPPADRLRGNAAHYTRDAAEYDYAPSVDSELGQIELRRAQLLLRLAGLDQPAPAGENQGLVADFGIGGGQLAAMMAELGWRPLGLDIAWHNCARARSERQALGDGKSGARFSAADLYALPLPDGCVKAGVVSEVLEHLEEPGAAVKELGRVLQPGGVLVASCPYREKLVWHLCIHCNQPTPANAHLHSVSESKMAGWMRDAGLEPGRAVFFNHKALVAMRWNRRVRRLPYGLWRAGEAAALALWRKPYHFAMVGVKK